MRDRRSVDGQAGVVEQGRGPHRRAVRQGCRIAQDAELLVRLDQLRFARVLEVEHAHLLGARDDGIRRPAGDAVDRDGLTECLLAAAVLAREQQRLVEREHQDALASRHEVPFRDPLVRALDRDRRRGRVGGGVRGRRGEQQALLPAGGAEVGVRERVADEIAVVGALQLRDEPLARQRQLTRMLSVEVRDDERRHVSLGEHRHHEMGFRGAEVLDVRMRVDGHGVLARQVGAEDHVVAVGGPLQQMHHDVGRIPVGARAAQSLREEDRRHRDARGDDHRDGDDRDGPAAPAPRARTTTRAAGRRRLSRRHARSLGPSRTRRRARRCRRRARPR